MIAKYLTFKDINKNIDKLPVILVGSIEQHGPFMPIGTDFLLAESLEKSLEKKFSKKILLFPVLPYGSAAEHQGFSGTMYLKDKVFLEMIKNLLNSFLESGFKKILLISTHGGNNKSLTEIKTEFKDTVSCLYVFTDEVDRFCIKQFGGVDKHAGSSENSLIAYLYPNMVKFIGQKQNKLFAPEKNSFKLYKTKEMTDLGIINFSPNLEVNSKKGKELYLYITKILFNRIESLI